MIRSKQAVEYKDCISAEEQNPPPNKSPGHEIKPSDSKAPALKLWRMQSTPSLSLLPEPLWPGVVVTNRALSMDQSEQTVCKQMTDV